MEEIGFNFSGFNFGNSGVGNDGRHIFVQSSVGIEPEFAKDEKRGSGKHGAATRSVAIYGGVVAHGGEGMSVAGDTDGSNASVLGKAI